MQDDRKIDTQKRSALGYHLVLNTNRGARRSSRCASPPGAEVELKRNRTPRSAVRQDKGRSDFVCMVQWLEGLLADTMVILTGIYPIFIV